MTIGIVGRWSAVATTEMERRASSSAFSLVERVEAASLARLMPCGCAEFARGELARLIGTSVRSANRAIERAVERGTLRAGSKTQRLQVGRYVADSGTGQWCRNCTSDRRQLDRKTRT